MEQDDFLARKEQILNRNSAKNFKEFNIENELKKLPAKPGVYLCMMPRTRLFMSERRLSFVIVYASIFSAVKAVCQNRADGFSCFIFRIYCDRL